MISAYLLSNACLRTAPSSFYLLSPISHVMKALDIAQLKNHYFIMRVSSVLFLV